jgi:hypothetical protein
MKVLHMRCFWCELPYVNDEPACHHPELTADVRRAGQILAEVEFCDHFCCGRPPMVCQAMRLDAALKERRWYRQALSWIYIGFAQAGLVRM